MFFFFKQKTAYELRISDWSSDVCSSDLTPQPAPAATQPVAVDDTPEQAPQPALEPFVATYEAYNKGDLAGNATMKVVHNDGTQWRVEDRKSAGSGKRV